MNGVLTSNINSYQTHLKYMRFSSSKRINQAKGDAAGLAIAEKFLGQIRGNDIAVRNMQQSQSLGRVAEGALGQAQSITHRMKELSIQANNGMLTDKDRGHLQREFDGLRDTLNAIGRDTQWNTKPLLDGSLIDLNTTTNGNGQSFSFSVGAALASTLGDAKTGRTLLDVDLRENPGEAIAIVSGATKQLSGARGHLGAVDNRLTYAGNVTETATLNMKAAESRVRDADVAKNAIELQKLQLMQQAYFSSLRMGIGMSGMNVNLLF